jgi:hypothetical protein
MENKNDRKLQEQHAPLKNSDTAFVQVGHNGEPVIPKEEERKPEQAQEERGTTPDKR